MKKGSLVGEMQVAPADRKKTGTTITWLPDLEVVYRDRHPQGILHRRPPPPGGGERRHRLPVPGPGEKGFAETVFAYENGIVDYVTELAGTIPDPPVFWQTEREGPGPAGQARL